jgi:hypothetical protein
MALVVSRYVGAAEESRTGDAARSIATICAPAGCA